MILRPKVILLLVAAIFSASFTTFAQTPTPTPEIDDPIEKVFIEEVKLNVSAFDGEGKFFSGVTKDDLVITDSGRLHQPTSVRRIPANILIVLDTGGELRQGKNLDQTRKTAANFVKSLAAEDSVALLQYNDKAEIISEWTTDKSDTLEVLKRRLNFGKRSLFVEALETATEFLEKNPFENKHLVMITDGTDSFDRQNEIRKAMQNLLATNISVHIISYTKLELEIVQKRKQSMKNGVRRKSTVPDGAGPPTQGRTQTYPVLTINLDREMVRSINKRADDLNQSEAILADLSKNTNGEFILPGTIDEMIEKPASIARSIDSSYVVTYTPKVPINDAQQGETREVIVTSKREGLEVFAKRKIVAQTIEPEKL
jgi:VWFA-related protein